MKVRFKTNINCQSCIQKVTPYLQSAAPAAKWTVDTTAPEKWLDMEAEIIDTAKIIQFIAVAGFKAEVIHA